MAVSETRTFWRQGEPFVWAAGGALAFILVMAGALLLVVLRNGLGVFWPAELTEFSLKGGKRFLGEIIQEEKNPDAPGTRLQLKIGNRDVYGLDFRWIARDDLAALPTKPKDALVLERMEYGNFHGYLKAFPAAGGSADFAAFLNAWATARTEAIACRAADAALAGMSARIEAIRLDRLRLTYRGAREDDPAVRQLDSARAELQADFSGQVAAQAARRAALRKTEALFADAGGAPKRIPLADIVRVYAPNRMSTAAKLGHYLERLRELLLDDPRESNTEGGLFPAIFGTVLMIFLMSLLSFPLGMVAGIYLREYAKDGVFVRLVRIAVNNLAGIPSIVYGIFGLGFFIYGIGGSLDRIFFPERLPTPTFGTGGILWASLTLGLLTVPVVIVATEEALGSIPRGIREGSLALGATRFQTLARVLLPMASPGILTGFILAMARAAGEVAPLMITGVVKLAPSLPLDGQFPYFHLDRKFMHLGFHIYDIGFQSPNVEAAKPMVYVTTLLLLLIVLAMSGAAIVLRNRMRKRYVMSAL